MLTALFASPQAMAKGPTSKFVCHYGSAENPQILTLEAPPDFDLALPLSNTVDLKVNGQNSLTQFKIHRVNTIVGGEIIYSYRNPFFVSDIQITYVNDQLSGVETVKGKWTTDYPPVIQLSCRLD
jgi:hypothetical protein